MKKSARLLVVISLALFYCLIYTIFHIYFPDALDFIARMAMGIFVGASIGKLDIYLRDKNEEDIA